MSKIILGLVGSPAAGKGEATAYIVDKYKASAHRFSTPMFDCLKRLFIPDSRINLIKFSEITREAFGDDLYAKVVAQDCANDTAEVVVVEGIRRMADISLLNQLDNFHLIYITASVEIRYERTKQRGEKAGENEMTLETFLAQEQASTEVLIPAIGATAKYMIDNSGTKEELHSKIDEIMKVISSKF